MPIFARRGAAMPVALHGPPPSLSVGAQASARPEAVVATAVVAATERTTHASNRATADTADEDSSRTRSGPPLFALKGSIRPSGDGCEAAGRGARATRTGCARAEGRGGATPLGFRDSVCRLEGVIEAVVSDLASELNACLGREAVVEAAPRVN